MQAIKLINTLTKELDIHAAMESVRHVALELLECERVTLFLIIESRQELRLVQSICLAVSTHSVAHGSMSHHVIVFAGLTGIVRLAMQFPAKSSDVWLELAVVCLQGQHRASR